MAVVSKLWGAPRSGYAVSVLGGHGIFWEII